MNRGECGGSAQIKKSKTYLIRRDTITEAQKKLVEDNHNLIYSLLAKHRLSIEEYYDLAAIGLCKASLTYKEDKSRFSTYAYKCMFSELAHELRKEKAKIRIPKNQIIYYQAELEHNNGDTAPFLNFLPSDENIEDKVVSKVLLNEYMKDLTERDRMIFDLFSRGYKQREIGMIAGYSQSHISRIKKRLVDYLNE